MSAGANIRASTRASARITHSSSSLSGAGKDDDDDDEPQGHRLQSEISTPSNMRHEATISTRFDYTGTERLGDYERAKMALKEWRHGGLRVFGSIVLRSQAFDLFMCSMILLNSIAIGVEQSLRLEGIDTFHLELVENGFLLVYILELSLRIFVDRLDSFASYWVRFDCFLVILGMLTNWIFVPLLANTNTLGPVLVLRTTRLFRLARTVKLIVRFRDLFMLVRGLLHSISTMFHVLLMFIMVIYICGVVCMETITLAVQPDMGSLSDETRDIIFESFRSLPITMLTLVQFITFDNVVYIYKPMIEEDWRMTLLFVVMLLMFGIVLMNLVTAVIVNSALEQAMQDKDMVRLMDEEKKKTMMKKLKRVFLRIDADGSGEVSREEVTSINDDDRELLRELTGVDDPGDIFDQLDVDGDNSLNVSEFCKGLEAIAFSTTSMELKRMERQIDTMYKQLRESKTMQESLQFVVKDLLEELQGGSYEMSGKSKQGGESQDAEALAAGEDAAKKPARRAALPPWTGQLLAEMRRVCKKDIRMAVEEANRPLALEVQNVAEAMEAQTEAQANSHKLGFSFPIKSLPSSLTAKKHRTTTSSNPDKTARGVRLLRTSTASAPEILNGRAKQDPLSPPTLSPRNCDDGFPDDHSEGSQGSHSRDPASAGVASGVLSNFLSLKAWGMGKHRQQDKAVGSAAGEKEEPREDAPVESPQASSSRHFSRGLLQVPARNSRGEETWDAAGWSCPDSVEPDPLTVLARAPDRTLQAERSTPRSGAVPAGPPTASSATR